MEVMVVAMVIAILSLGISGYMFQQIKQQQSARVQQSNSSVVNEALLAAGQVESLSVTQDMQFQNIPAVPTPTLSAQLQIAPYWANSQVDSYDYNGSPIDLSSGGGTLAGAQATDPNPEGGLLGQINTQNTAAPASIGATSQTSAHSSTPCSDPPGLTPSMAETHCHEPGTVQCNLGLGMKLMWDESGCTWRCVNDCTYSSTH